jgi:hypothetical protein
VVDKGDRYELQVEIPSLKKTRFMLKQQTILSKFQMNIREKVEEKELFFIMIDYTDLFSRQFQCHNR